MNRQARLVASLHAYVCLYAGLDLDSLSSSLLYAYISSSAPTAGGFAPIYIPMLNIKESELRLRPEFTTVCGHIGIKVSNLPNLSDITSGFACPEDTHWILVDHNKPSDIPGKDNASCVIGVIDHHDEEDYVARETASEPRLVAKAGSCTSLVVQYCRSSWDRMSDSSQVMSADCGQRGIFEFLDAMQSWDAELAMLALASILIDTANMTASQRIQEVDKQAVEYLVSKIQRSEQYSKTWDQRTFYARLEAAKNSMDSLTVAEILSKDFKAWTENGIRLGICSVVKPLTFLVAKCSTEVVPGSLEQVVTAFMEDRALDLLAIMTVFKSEQGQLSRELLLQARYSAIDVATCFVATVQDRLDITILKLNGISDGWNPKGQIWCRSWLQGNVGESRKQVAPLIRAAMREFPASQFR